MSSSPHSESDAALRDEELQLFRQSRAGDWDAFQKLVTRFQSRVFAVAMRVLGQQQDAEDVTQQTFLSVIEHLDQFREESPLAHWILRIATNHSLKILRKRRGLPTVSLDAAGSEESYASLPHPDYIAQWRDDPAELAQRAEVREMIERQLMELDERYRLVFILRDIEGFSVRETAEMLSLSEANVKVQLLRARLALREQLTKEFGDEATRADPSHLHEQKSP